MVYAKCRYDEAHLVNAITLNVVRLSVVAPNFNS
jgi:hypothetical protein